MISELVGDALDTSFLGDTLDISFLDNLDNFSDPGERRDTITAFLNNLATGSNQSDNFQSYNFASVMVPSIMMRLQNHDTVDSDATFRKSAMAGKIAKLGRKSSMSSVIAKSVDKDGISQHNKTVTRNLRMSIHSDPKHIVKAFEQRNIDNGNINYLENITKIQALGRGFVGRNRAAFVKWQVGNVVRRNSAHIHPDKLNPDNPRFQERNKEILEQLKRDSTKELYDAAVKITAITRGFLARKRVSELQNEVDIDFLGLDSDILMTKDIEKDMRESSPEKDEEEKIEIERMNTIQKLQAVFRGRKSREQVSFLKNIVNASGYDKGEVNAAVEKIAAGYKSMKTRRMMNSIRESSNLAIYQYAKMVAEESGEGEWNEQDFEDYSAHVAKTECQANQYWVFSLSLQF